jgi:phage tail P2-like protein
MDLTSVDVLVLQSTSMKEDIAVQGFSAALTLQLRKLVEEVDRVGIYYRIDEQPEEVLDLLAWQYKVDWYDMDSPIEIKREAVKNALEIHKIKGTPDAVQRIIDIYFGDGTVEEWFDYGGAPGNFRISTMNPSATNEKAALLIKAVNAVKRKTAHLEAVLLIVTDDMPIYFSGVLQVFDHLTIEQVV